MITNVKPRSLATAQTTRSADLEVLSGSGRLRDGTLLSKRVEKKLKGCGKLRPAPALESGIKTMRYGERIAVT